MQITANSKTLTDNIFYNDVTNNIISGNITTSISDHLTQFLIKIHPRKTRWSTQMKKDHLEMLVQWLLRMT